MINEARFKIFTTIHPMHNRLVRDTRQLVIFFA